MPEASHWIVKHTIAFFPKTWNKKLAYIVLRTLPIAFSDVLCWYTYWNVLILCERQLINRLNQNVIVEIFKIVSLELFLFPQQFLAIFEHATPQSIMFCLSKHSFQDKYMLGWDFKYTKTYHSIYLRLGRTFLLRSNIFNMDEQSTALSCLFLA